MRASSFTHDFLLLFAGPLIWSIHFLAIYAFTGIVCARPGAAASWWGIGVVTWALAGAGLAAIAAIAAFFAVKPRDAAPDNRSFIRRVSAGLGVLSIIAIVWETMTVFLVPSCAYGSTLAASFIV